MSRAHRRVGYVDVHGVGVEGQVAHVGHGRVEALLLLGVGVGVGVGVG